jgi:phosphoglycerate dehydrogenase-like enzyme
LQILMSKAAYDRVADRLLPMARGVDLITTDALGGFNRGGDLIADEDVDPEVFWISLDLWRSGGLPALFSKIATGTRGRWAQSFAAGVDHPSFRAVVDKGLRLTNSDAQAPAIAEYVVAQAFSLLHPIEQQLAAQASKQWRQIDFREISSTRWLLIGFGAIGQQIANRLQPFRPRIAAVRRQAIRDDRLTDVCTLNDVGRLLPHTDVVVLACALNSDTRDLAGPAFFESLKPGSILINVGRGELMDEAALRLGLERDQPARAVLDVFRSEPLSPEAWLWTHPKIRVTAHASNAGDKVMGRGDDLFLQNLRLYLAGQPLVNEVPATNFEAQ